MLVETEIIDQRLADKCRIRIEFSIFHVLQSKINEWLFKITFKGEKVEKRHGNYLNGRGGD